jgi:hypothetical protein
MGAPSERAVDENLRVGVRALDMHLAQWASAVIPIGAVVTIWTVRIIRPPSEWPAIIAAVETNANPRASYSRGGENHHQARKKRGESNRPWKSNV